MRSAGPMRDAPTDCRGRLDLAEMVARIERQQEETRKSIARQRWQAGLVTAGGFAALIGGLLTILAALHP